MKRELKLLRERGSEEGGGRQKQRERERERERERDLLETGQRV
jgi:hypothetical protein